MKISSLFIFIYGITVCIFGQIRNVETEIIRNRLYTGGYSSFTHISKDDTESATELGIPVAVYRLETVQEDLNSFDMTINSGYRLYREKSENLPDVDNDFSKSFYIDIDPEIEFRLHGNKGSSSPVIETIDPDTYWDEVEEEESDDFIYSEPEGPVHKWFTSVALPMYYESDETTLDMRCHFGYDDMLTDIKNLTPWEHFKKGFSAYAVFEYRLTEEREGVTGEKRPLSAGIFSEYARELHGVLSKSTGTAFLDIKHQFIKEARTELRRVFNTKGYEGTYTEFSYGLGLAKDINSKININTSATASTIQLYDTDNNRINILDMNARFNYYTSPAFNVFCALNINSHFKEDSKPTDTKITLGAMYKFEFLEAETYDY